MNLEHIKTDDRKCCTRCGASEEFETLAFRGEALVCQECDDEMEREWVGDDPETRSHYLDTFAPR